MKRFLPALAAALSLASFAPARSGDQPAQTPARRHPSPFQPTDDVYVPPPPPWMTPAGRPVLTVPQLVKQTEGSVVLVSVCGTVSVRRDGRVVEKFVGGFGTGFAIGDGRHVVTNHHVVADALDRNFPWKGGKPDVRVELPRRFLTPPPGPLSPEQAAAQKAIDRANGRATVAARVVGADEATDLAVLEVPPGLLTPVRFADPASIATGEDVVAIGFGQGDELTGAPSVTRGIITATGRNFHGVFGDLIQTDAVINHGNSGGPLFNLRGEVVGVNTYGLGTDVKFDFRVRTKDQARPALLAGCGGVLGAVLHREGVPAAGPDGSIRGEVEQRLSLTQGVFFARSARTARPIAEKLIRGRAIDRAPLGVALLPMNRWEQMQRGIGEGALVSAVERGSAADRAGIKPGFLITRLGGHDVRCPGDLRDALALLDRGQTVTVSYYDTNAKAAGQTADEGDVILLDGPAAKPAEAPAAGGEQTLTVTLK